MRDWINTVLSFIGTTSLTDDEFESLPIEAAMYDQDTYDAIVGVLQSRESVSNLLDRLTAYWQARGIEFTPATNGRSNILVGAVLE